MTGGWDAPPIRVLIAEDHALVRAGIRRLLDDLAGVEVVAEARDGREAAEMILRHVPDIALVDMTMPGLNGLAVIVRARAEAPSVRAIVLSMHDNEEFVWEALAAGAAGYLLKDASPTELELAVRAVAAGGAYLSPAVSRHVVHDYVRRGAPAQASGLERLTQRQREIVQLIAEGNTNNEIANSLTISLKTVETHRSALMARLDIHDVAGLVRYAVRMGLVERDS
jgi:DNA-binding NarL/FixJ family response regulator